MSEITNEMVDKFANDDDALKQNIVEFGRQMKTILSLWDRNMRFMTSAAHHTDDKIDTFQADVIAMRDAMNSIVDWDPYDVLKLFTTIKAHFLFDMDENNLSHVLEDVRKWKCTGSIDEQNIELMHAIVNQLNRQFGNCRGKRKKMLWLREHQWTKNPVIQHLIEVMLEATRRKNVSNVRRTAPEIMASEKKYQQTADEELPCDDDGQFLSADLNDDEKEMNSNASLRGPVTEDHNDYASLSDEDKKLLLGMDTKLCACLRKGCHKRFVSQTALQIHCLEAHSVSISTDIDTEEVTTVATYR